MRRTEVTRPGPFATVATGVAHADTRVTGVGKRGVTALFDWLLSMAERRRQRRALSGLDEHLLKDIGLNRSEVEQEITKPFWRG
ncbi:DUF1127 domain-containing protein [Azospirillum griseum]|nr:DUF1127 domain-containing protein [Azospirillum griseum]